MIKARFSFDNPDNLEATVAITMTLRDWKRLRDQLKDTAYPAWRVDAMLRELVEKAEASFEKTYDTGDE